jgi:hypothetical protein
MLVILGPLFVQLNTQIVIKLLNCSILGPLLVQLVHKNYCKIVKQLKSFKIITKRTQITSFYALSNSLFPNYFLIPCYTVYFTRFVFKHTVSEYDR